MRFRETWKEIWIEISRLTKLIDFRIKLHISSFHRDNIEIQE